MVKNFLRYEVKVYDEETTMRFKIDRHGDLLGDIYLCVTMPDIYSYYTTSTNVFIMKWVKHLGFHMIKKVHLYIGNQICTILFSRTNVINCPKNRPKTKQNLSSPFQALLKLF